MTRKARNPGSGKPPSNAPAHGPGWGGPAKGFVEHADKAPSFTPDAAAPDRDPETGKFTLSPKGEVAKKVAEEMLGKLVTIARESDFEGNALSAAEKVMDRIWGKPRQATDLRVIKRPEDLSDEELEALEIEMTRRQNERE